MSSTHCTIVEGTARLMYSLPFPAFPVTSGLWLKLQLKSILEFIGALVLLLMTAPLFLLAASLIKLTSPGPVFFRQERLGLYQRPFKIWKFRTMVAGSELAEKQLHQNRGGVFFKLHNDPRVTNVGRYLRKYSIDELPQLINVLRREMALVGPRPIMDSELQRFGEWIYLRRFRMRPGLTCIWQVSGRSNTSDWDRMRQDMKYVDSWSLWLDTKILIKTVGVVVKTTGAV